MMKSVNKKVNISLRTYTRTQTIHRKKKKTVDQYRHEIMFMPYAYAM